ncbi:hypothetical protein GGR57DRAFT_502990 [Xylariaceae sp. FL1272]|nr:hypothetical protein GGR57DRAFT_502990 [Xylariaceae sp. FL1272]
MSSSDAVNAFVAGAIAHELGLPRAKLNLNRSFVGNGGDSLSAINIVSSCRFKGIPITVGMILRHASLGHFLNELEKSTKRVGELPGSIDLASPFPPFLESFGPHECVDNEEQRHPSQATPLQLSFIHGSKTHVGHNVIRYFETYRTEHIPVVKHAWEAVARAEPIFRTRLESAGSMYHMIEGTETFFHWSEMTVESHEANNAALSRYTPGTDFAGITFHVVHLKVNGQSLQSTVVWTIHHALIDGFSSVTLLNKHRGALSGHPCQPGLSFSAFMGQVQLFRESQEQEKAAFKFPVIDSNSSAYLCFTSGPTGKPKGVRCTHKGLVAFQSGFDIRMKSKPGWRIAQFMSPAFDGSIHEIFSALSYGSTLVLGCAEHPFSQLRCVDAAIMTPSIARVLDPNDFPNLKALYLVGETVSPFVRDRWTETVETYNMYGPTEGTCGATTKKLEYGRPITLGRRNPTMRIYVLSPEGQLVPPGLIGDIYLAGVQVSLGYQNMPHQTDTAFVKDTVYTLDEERMYRTGDRGYWCENGELQFCGRTDRQIKLRGYRVDLDDVEERIRNAICDCTDVMVVCIREQIIAYLQPESLAIKSIETCLAQALPSYALPRQIVRVSEFPRTKAGKLDYHAVQQYSVANQEPTLTQGNTKLARQVAEVWKEILHLSDDITATSTFLELGGNSLLQLQMADRLSAVLGRKIPFLSIVSSPTLGSLVETLDDPASDVETLVTSTSANYKIAAVTQLEQHWCEKYCFRGGSSSFTVSAGFRLGPDVVISRVTPLIRVLVTHDTLLLVASHIICDYKSLETMLDEASCSYQGNLLSPLVHCEVFKREYPQRDVEFWRWYLKDIQRPVYSIGAWMPRKSWDGTSSVYRLPAHINRTLAGFATAKGLTPHQILLAVVSLALSYKSDKLDMVLGAPHLGRRGQREEEAMGLFLELLPVRVKYPEEDNGQRDFLTAVRDASQLALSHALPWLMILDALELASTVPDTALVDTVVSYQDSFGKLDMAGVGAEPWLTWTEGAKFKLMAEFIKANDECLLLGLEWANECFDEQSIGALAELIKISLETILEGASYQQVAERLLWAGDRKAGEGFPGDQNALFWRHITKYVAVN